jgi:threonine synthase
LISTKCDKCSKIQILPENSPFCVYCGGSLQIISENGFEKSKIIKDRSSLWRYANFLPFDYGYSPKFTFGEGNTPLLNLHSANNLYIKMECKTNTFSFLDRGASVAINFIGEKGESLISTFSLSGDAAASLAAYCAKAGISFIAFLSKYVSKLKRNQITLLGGIIDSREVNSIYEAINILPRHQILPWIDPLFLEGTKTVAFEIWEQMGETIPEVVILPIGHGALLSGIYKGFYELLESGIVTKLPKFIGVRSSSCPPWIKEETTDNQKDRKNLASLEFSFYKSKESIAEGILVPYPIRFNLIQKILSETKGYIIDVSDSEVAKAAWELGKNGFCGTPTGIAGFAGFLKLQEQEELQKGNNLVLITAWHGENETWSLIEPFL